MEAMYELALQTSEIAVGKEELTVRHFQHELAYNVIPHIDIFQDLVEAEILYTAVFNNSKTLHFHPEKLESCPDLTGDFTEEQDLKDIVHVYDVSGKGCKVYNDIADEHLVITC